MTNKYDSYIFDLDGTVYRGDDIITGADKTINCLKESGKKIIFISNKTTGTIREYYTFLKSFGLNIEESEILNSTYVLKNYLKENTVCNILFFGEKAIGLTLPNFVNLKIIKADPWAKGDTAAGSTKPATLETGYVVQVPPFVEEGELVRIDTRTGQYVERVKK
jgi:ribonucleotide monophosphatase NagD (HAD superfamily)